MQHQTQYYRTVPVSEKPKHPDLYHTLIEHEKLDIEGIPCHNNYIGTPNGGYWETDDDSQVTHYLQRVAIPDAAVLRRKMQEILDISRDGNIEEPYPLRWKLLPKIATIAREALSAVGDGWVRVKDRLPTSEDADERGYVMTYRRDDRQWGWPTSQGFSKWKRVTPSTHTHWRPLPPQPINK